MRTIQRDIVGAFIFSKDKKLLLGKSIKGGVYANSWIIPGGGIEPGEMHLAALKREVLEETGIDISAAAIEPLEGILTGQSEKTIRKTGERVVVDMRFFNYKVTLAQPSGFITLHTDDDFIQADWFPVNELRNLDLSPPSVTTLKKLGLL